MLELPESDVLAQQLEKTLVGKTIREMIVEQTPHRFAFFSEHKDRYGELLTGQTVQSARRHGGIAELNTESAMLYFSDGAYPRYFGPNEAKPKKHQLYLGFEDGSCLAVSVQMYGYIGVFPLGECTHAYYRIAAEKPDPLDSAFTYGYFCGLRPEQEGKLTLKSFLATQQRIPGLGNGVLQDILWNAGLDPRKSLRDITEDNFCVLYGALVKTLKEMRRMGGRNTERDLFGNKGGYPCVMSKDTLGSPCPRCGHAIEKAAYLGGAIYFCPGCQAR